VWREKQEASSREALCEVETQIRLSREDKGKTPLSFHRVAYASREAEFLLASPNPKALVLALSSLLGVKLREHR